MTPKERHDIISALRTMELAHGLLEMGYQFNDGKAPAMIKKLGESVKYINDLVEVKILNHNRTGKGNDENGPAHTRNEPSEEGGRPVA